MTALLLASVSQGAIAQEQMVLNESADAKIENRASEDADAKQSPTPADNPQSVDDLYKSVFGKDRPDTDEGVYGILIDGIYVGEYNILPEKSGVDGAVSSKFVTDILSKIVVGEKMQAINNVADNRDMVPFADLRAFDLSVEFDPTQLVLKVGIPMEARAIRDLQLRGLRKRGDIATAEQADVSGFVSVRAGLTVVEDSRLTDTGIARFASDIDAVLNVHNIVLSAEFRYDDARSRPFTRGDITLSYDDRDSLIRYELGDLTIGRRPFQTAPRISGIGVYRQFGINPYLNFRPTPQQGFEIDRPARVEVVVNGSTVRSYDLPAGRFNLRDFPIVSSAGNDIELRIRYASGETETRIFPAFYDLELLSPGLIDFAVNVGLPYEDRDGFRRYNDNDYNGIAYIRHGLNATVTAGLHWEGNRTFDTFGAEVVWASPFGTFGFNMATNVREFGLDDSQFSLQYRWRDANPERERMVDISAVLTGEDFKTLDQIFSGTFVTTQVRVRGGQKIGPDTRMQVYGGYEEYREFDKATIYAGVEVSHQFRFGSVAIGGEYRDGPDENGFAFRIAFSIPFGRASTSGSYTTRDNAARIEYNHLSSVGVNSFGYNFGAERRDGSDRQFVRATYTGNRFEGSVQQTARNYFSNADQRDFRTDFSFGTAIVMADGQFGLSRPVRNSFAIVRADKSAGAYQLAVEPRTGFGSTETSYSGYSGALGPAVVPSLSPYFDRIIQVDAPDAPAGTSLGGQVFIVNPSNKSGFVLTVGGAGNVSVVGNMVDRDGDPFAYITGQATMVGGDAEAKPITFFTNARGRFVIDGAEAGKSYTLDLETNEQSARQSLTIPEDMVGTYRLEGYVYFDLDVPPPDADKPQAREENDNGVQTED